MVGEEGEDSDTARAADVAASVDGSREARVDDAADDDGQEDEESEGEGEGERRAEDIRGREQLHEQWAEEDGAGEEDREAVPPKH